MHDKKLQWPRKEYFSESIIAQLREKRMKVLKELKDASCEKIGNIVKMNQDSVRNYYQVSERPSFSSFRETMTIEKSYGKIIGIDVLLDNSSVVSLTLGIPQKPKIPHKVILGLHGTHESREYYLDILSHQARKGHENSTGFLVPAMEAGFIVVCPDLPTFGNGYPGEMVNSQKFGKYIQEVDTISRLIGRCYAAETVGEVMAVIDFLEAYPEIEACSYGVSGFSLGGQSTSLLAACDPRISVAADVAGLSTYEQFFRIWPERITDITYIFGENCLGVIGDLWTIALSIAPKAQLRIACTDDIYVPFKSVEDIMEILDPVYCSYGCRDNLKMVKYNGPHGIQKGMIQDVIDWFEVNMNTR